MPDHFGVGHSANVARALHVGPPVVGTLGDQVQLVPAVLAKLGSPKPALVVESEALDVAVAVTEHLVVERVTRRRSAIESESQDLPSERIFVLGESSGAALARTDIQVVVRTDHHAAAIVDKALGNAAENDL